MELIHAHGIDREEQNSLHQRRFAEARYFQFRFSAMDAM
jgi:hypothetical protein